MSEVVQSLNENLKSQVLLYEKLYNLERDKQAALIKNDLSEIDAITVQQEQVITETSQLEKERLKWAEVIGVELGKVPEDLTLAELAGHFPVLEGVRHDLDKVIGLLREIHDINSQLLHQAMQVVDFTVGLLTHQEKRTYSDPKRKKQEENGQLHLMDWRV